MPRPPVDSPVPPAARSVAKPSGRALPPAPGVPQRRYTHAAESIPAARVLSPADILLHASPKAASLLALCTDKPSDGNTLAPAQRAP
ncbi:MAG: hypothetical protein OXC80_07190 [Gammaproteobacteria bacterium]|nr:hypothetical protein [Gammaproteobacteria bacterium]